MGRCRLNFCVSTLRAPALGLVVLLLLIATRAKPTSWPLAHAEAAGSIRIVSLAPSITETLFALSAGKQVVGVTQYCDYPPEVRRLPKIGSFLTPNVEAIVALHPSLIIGLESSANQREVRSLRSIGYPLLLVREDSLEDIQQSIYQIGQRIGQSDRASELARRIKEHFELVRGKLENTAPNKVVMLVGHAPMVAVGNGTFLSELLVVARANNIAARLAQQWPRLSVEYVIATGPDVIIDGQMGSDAASPRNFWRKYPTIPAVRQNRIYGFPEDPILRPGPRIWKSLDMLVALIHPEISLPSELDRDRSSAGAL